MDNFIEELRGVVGSSAVLSEPDELLVYECDGLPQHKYRPRAVVFPSTTEETAAVMRVLARERVPFTPRGAGTGLSGGALALNQGVVIELARMRKILKIDEANRIAVVQPGVVNAHVSRAVAHLGLHYVPDPSSQPTCTIGGNIAESAGGVHCLKYGTTTDHVLGVRVVLAGGEVVDLGGETQRPGYDLVGAFVGAEGTFGIATEATLRLVPLPPAVRTMLAEFSEVNDASHAVSAIIAGGIMPAGLEMMDREIIRAVEASVFAAGLPLDVGAALLIELDGVEAGLDEEAERVTAICRQHGARNCRLARDEHERKKLWAARKGAFGAIGRISPDSMIQDAVVPRSRLPEVLDAAYRIASKYQLRIANVFHAGDGNLHPLICFDSRFPEEVHRVKEAGRELMETCVRAGGSITGEHGVGLDKRELLSLIFSEADMGAMLEVRAAFDPTGLCNPGKIIPMLRGCGEARATQTSNTETDGRAGRKGNEALTPGTAGVAPPSSSGFTRDKVESLNPGYVAFNDSGGDARGPSRSEARSDSRPFDSESAKRRLESIVMQEGISEAVASYLIVSPGSIEETCEVMKLASSARWTVAPAGAMTWLDAGQPLSSVNLILSPQRLTRLVEHEPADLVAITEAGVTLKDFNDALATKGQWLPIDPPDVAERGGATVGGVVATGLGGAQQFGYGSPRRHVIGMKVVRADGSLIKAGGRVVKNVAGYDLCKLFTGSYGTLGVIVEANFKLRPLPFETKTVMAWGLCDNLVSRARQIINTGLFPVAVEVLSPGFANKEDWSDGKEHFLFSGRTSAPLEENSHLLLVRFAGSSGAVSQQVRQAMELLGGGPAPAPECFDENDGTIWQTVASLPLLYSSDVVCRIGVRPDGVAPFLKAVNQSHPELLWQAGIGDGRIRVVERRQSADNESQESQTKLIKRIRELRDIAERLDGSLAIEEAPAAIKNLIHVWGNFGSAGGIMQRVKRQLDPDGILSPGRFGFE